MRPHLCPLVFRTLMKTKRSKYVGCFDDLATIINDFNFLSCLTHFLLLHILEIWIQDLLMLSPKAIFQKCSLSSSSLVRFCNNRTSTLTQKTATTWWHGAAGCMSCCELTSPRALVVKEDPVASKHVVGLSKVHYDPVGVELCSTWDGEETGWQKHIRHLHKSKPFF